MRKSQNKCDDTLSALGDLIYQRRMNLRMSQQDLADKSEVHRTYISDIERGMRNLTISTFMRICSALATSPARLFKQVEERINGSAPAKRRSQA